MIQRKPVGEATEWEMVDAELLNYVIVMLIWDIQGTHRVIKVLQF